MSCWGLVLGCLFICSPSVGQLAREGHSADSQSTRLPPSLAAWLRGAVVPGEHGARPAPGFAQAYWRKVLGGKRHLLRRAGMELHPQILKCWGCGNRNSLTEMESQEAPGTTWSNCICSSAQLEHPLNCAWAGPQVKKQKCLTPLPSSALI